MDILSLFKNIDVSNRNSYFLIEALISKLLLKHLEDQGRPYFPEYRLPNGRIVDGFAPDGIDDLIGSTIIEVRLNRTTSRSMFDNIREVLDRTYSVSYPTHRNILLIFISELPEEFKDQIIKYTSHWPEDLKLKVWEAKDISSLLQKYAEYVSDIVPQLTDIAISNVVEKSLGADPQEWKGKNSEYISSIKSAYNKDDLTIFLGAGVSLTAGLPTWNTLIYKLFVAMIGRKFPENLKIDVEETNFIVKSLTSFHSSSPLLAARYIRQGLDGVFEQEVSNALYKNNDNIKQTSELLTSIARLCIPRRNGPGIKAVVNYNFDDLIEKHLENVGVQFRSIYRDSDIVSQEELGIFHVHGFLPRDIERYDGVSESLLVFSEEGYHSLYIDPYSWSNITQLNFFRESTCLFIGLSMTDPNMRRLLDIAAKKNKDKDPKHYVILKRQLPSELGTYDNAVRNTVVESYITVHHRLQETSFQELGLNIIWVENYDEIPNILDQIRS
ncbi:MAG TPA: SIR2 family protein [Paenibacillus sp.]|nr:SIR2 family protein [Paenibacillus sp.]